MFLKKKKRKEVVFMKIMEVFHFGSRTLKFYKTVKYPNKILRGKKTQPIVIQSNSGKAISSNFFLFHPSCKTQKISLFPLFFFLCLYSESWLKMRQSSIVPISLIRYAIFYLWSKPKWIVID